MLVYLRTAVAVMRDRRAVTSIEYGLIAALIAVVIVVSVSKVGIDLTGTFNKISTEL
jgi:pilus assembly protein Flp/PilA